MSILLLGFKNYDNEPHEWFLDGEDAVRLIRTIPGMTCRRNAVAFVTIYPRGLDNEGESGDFGAGATTRADSIDVGQTSIFDGR